MCHVCEGESEVADENKLIATVDLPIWHHMTRHAVAAPEEADGTHASELAPICEDPCRAVRDETGRQGD